MKNREESLAKATKNLMLKNSFYGLFLMQLNKHWTDKIETSGVAKNGINVGLYINELFWESLTDVWRMMVLQHDCLHVVFHHLEISLPEKDIMAIASN